MLWLKDQAPHASPRGAFCEVDPQECGGLRQGNIALIHSAPTGERFPPIEPSFRDGALAPDPESRDSGFDAAHRPGMTILTPPAPRLPASSSCPASSTGSRSPHWVARG